MEKAEILIGISLLASSNIDEKLQLCFKIFDSDYSGFLSSAELANMIIRIEGVLDGRSSFYQKEAENMMKILDINNDSKVSLDEFIKTVKSHKIFYPIIEFISLLDRNEEYNEALQYDNIHSPIVTYANYSDDSHSDNFVEQNVLEAEIEDLPDFEENYEKKIENNEDEGLSNEKLTKTQDSEYFSVKDEETERNFENPSQDYFSSIRKQNESPNKFSKNRSESVGTNAEKIDFEHSMKHEQTTNDEHFIDFPEAQRANKDRDCQRLCSKETCVVF